MTETKKVKKEVPPVGTPIVDADFNLAAYERVVFLTIDKERRKGGQLTDAEKIELEAAEIIAFNNPGRKATKTDTYNVAMRTVRLVKGLPTPDSVIGLFSRYGQDKLFS